MLTPGVNKLLTVLFSIWFSARFRKGSFIALWCFQEGLPVRKVSGLIFQSDRSRMRPCVLGQEAAAAYCFTPCIAQHARPSPPSPKPHQRAVDCERPHFFHLLQPEQVYQSFHLGKKRLHFRKCKANLQK